MLKLVIRNLIHYRHTNLAVVAGIAAAVAALAGALLVGQSVRHSLRSLLYQRLGATEFVVSGDRFFREDLADALSSTGETEDSIDVCPIIYLQGTAIHEGTGKHAYNVSIYGIDDRFWKFQSAAGRTAPQDRVALVGAPLSERLGVHAGDSILLTIETQQGIPRESLYGRRENIGRTVRLVCGELLPPDKLGEFALRPNQGSVHAIFVSLQRLQKDLAQPSSVNTVLLTARSQPASLQQIRDSLKKRLLLRDLGVKLRSLPSQAGIAVESTRILLDPSIAQAAVEAAAEAGAPFSGVFTYLANSIRAGGREIPYSVITAADLGQGAMNSVRLVEGSLPPLPGDTKESIWLNEWAKRDLAISLGDPVEVEYYIWQQEGRLVTRTDRFRLAGVVSIGGDVNSVLAPDFPGITETGSMRSWDPPFPIDLSRIRPKDEAYWNQYRATPKAFITLDRGQELWQSRFGKLTAVLLDPGAQSAPHGTGGTNTASLIATTSDLASEIRDRIDPEMVGFAVTDVRGIGLEASKGSTDFGEYFVYFSSFLIAAAILLSALFFRLGIEQRVREIGTLQALGFPNKTLLRIFLMEGAILSFGGSALGLFGALGYGGLLVFGLGTWWMGAVGTRRMYLHVSWLDLGLGAAAGILCALAMIAWTLHGLRWNSPRALLAGVLESSLIRSQRARFLGIVSIAGFVGALLLLLGSGFKMISDVEGFFGAGFLLLVSILSLAALYLRRKPTGLISGNGWRAFLRLGARNAMHKPARSLLCVTLIASATFIIVSVEAFRQDPQSVSLERTSGTGGYSLLAESALPIIYDPNSDAGKEALGIPSSEVPELAQVRFVPFRVRRGDDASCLNLYAPQDPKILGATSAFLADARFSFQDSVAAGPEQARNPWLLLESDLENGAIPAIGDATTIQYILHLSIGKELIVRGSTGAPVRLRLVAALRDSILQGGLMISEANFLRAFPSQDGYQFFLLDVPPARAAVLAQSLMERLADWGLNVESAHDRLAAYHRVENTYLSTFQSLGVLGLILGTAGLAAVLLRNVLERRSELALMRAVGYRREILSAVVVVENLVLMLAGLACGTLCALLAMVPALHDRGTPFPFVMVGVVLTTVLIVGLTASLLAVVAAFRSPLLDALRSE